MHVKKGVSQSSLQGVPSLFSGLCGWVTSSPASCCSFQGSTTFIYPLTCQRRQKHWFIYCNDINIAWRLWYCGANCLCAPVYNISYSPNVVEFAFYLVLSDCLHYFQCESIRMQPSSLTSLCFPVVSTSWCSWSLFPRCVSEVGTFPCWLTCTAEYHPLINCLQYIYPAQPQCLLLSSALILTQLCSYSSSTFSVKIPMKLLLSLRLSVQRGGHLILLIRS